MFILVSVRIPSPFLSFRFYFSFEAPSPSTPQEVLWHGKEGLCKESSNPIYECEAKTISGELSSSVENVTYEPTDEQTVCNTNDANPLYSWPEECNVSPSAPLDPLDSVNVDERLYDVPENLNVNETIPLDTSEPQYAAVQRALR